MKNVRNRIVQYPMRFLLQPVSGQPNVYDLMPAPFIITDSGSDIDRAMLMAIQGFIGSEIIFNADGSITETNQDGDVLQTVFNADGSIVEMFTAETQSITKKISFLSDGSIKEDLL